MISKEMKKYFKTINSKYYKLIESYLFIEL